MYETSVLRPAKVARFSRRMRKTARPVAWEGDGAQSPSLDLIVDACPTQRMTAQQLTEFFAHRDESTVL